MVILFKLTQEPFTGKREKHELITGDVPGKRKVIKGTSSPEIYAS
jgi:hypothetical protein